MTSFNHRLFALPAFCGLFFIKSSPFGELSYYMKNHYLLTQIADILMQLYVAWNPYIKELKQTIKNTSSRLLESFRGLTITEEDVSYTSRYTTMYFE